MDSGGRHWTLLLSIVCDNVFKKNLKWDTQKEISKETL